MAAVCISNCARDTGSSPLQRPRYVNLYNWPESHAELLKTVGSTSDDGGGEGQYYFFHPPRVVDSMSCRQLYLRNGYRFSRKESVPEKTKKCFGRVKERVAVVAAMRKFQSRPGGVGTRRTRRSRKTRFVMVKKVKEFSCGALRSVFQRLLSCTTSVDVVERRSS